MSSRRASLNKKYPRIHLEPQTQYGNQRSRGSAGGRTRKEPVEQSAQREQNADAGTVQLSEQGTDGCQRGTHNKGPGSIILEGQVYRTPQPAVKLHSHSPARGRDPVAEIEN